MRDLNKKHSKQVKTPLRLILAQREESQDASDSGSDRDRDSDNKYRNSNDNNYNNKNNRINSADCKLRKNLKRNLKSLFDGVNESPNSNIKNNSNGNNHNNHNNNNSNNSNNNNGENEEREFSPNIKAAKRKERSKKRRRLNGRASSTGHSNTGHSNTGHDEARHFESRYDEPRHKSVEYKMNQEKQERKFCAETQRISQAASSVESSEHSYLIRQEWPSFPHSTQANSINNERSNGVYSQLAQRPPSEPYPIDDIDDRQSLKSLSVGSISSRRSRNSKSRKRARETIVASPTPRRTNTMHSSFEIRSKYEKLRGNNGSYHEYGDKWCDFCRTDSHNADDCKYQNERDGFCAQNRNLQGRPKRVAASADQEYQH